MRKLYYFFVNSGKVVFIWLIMLIVSICLYSLSIKGKVNYGNRCYVQFNDDVIANYNYDGIMLESANLQCNTYYLQYSSSLNENENLLFLARITKLLYDEDITINVHVIINTKDYVMISTIVDYKISYTTSNI